MPPARLPSLALATLLGLATAPLAAQEHQHHHPAAAPTAESAPDSAPPLYANLGTLHRAVATRSPLAQRYFDQGLRLTYAFNHAEAVRAFETATRLDSTCAMCWWGIANALGPNINLPMDNAAVPQAWATSERAHELAARETPANRALIEAATARYAPDTTTSRAGLDSAYADKLRAAFRRFPADPDIGALFGESMLDLRPWNQWTRDGKPQPGTLEAVAALERTIRAHPSHVGACHFYIHAVEASSTPERAVPCAQRLPALMPGAGHLVHMPAHIAIRLGDYKAAMAHNRHAVHADQTYFEGPHTESIYGVLYNAHNWHFLSVAAAMIGNRDTALMAARKTAGAVPVEVAREVPSAEYFLPMPYFALVRFERWDEMLAEPAPSADLRYTSAMYRFAHGMALAAKGDTAGAAADRDTLTAIRTAFPAGSMVGLQQVDAMLGIAAGILGGRLAARNGDGNDALASYEEAVRQEDGLSYDEPPPWYLPARQYLGTELLRQGDAKGAEAAFRADLRIYRENGWSLRGLAAALAAEGKKAEEAAVGRRFAAVWEGR
jgi:tetratricopeptide (TPR) repeat protein